jgi:hypothetical protein
LAPLSTLPLPISQSSPTKKHLTVLTSTAVRDTMSEDVLVSSAYLNNK